MVTNMDTWSKWMWQEVKGPLGSATPPHMGATQPPKWPCHITDPWELLQSQWEASIQVDLINGQDLFTVNPWAHYRRLGSLHRLTSRHTCRISPCAGFTTDLENQLAPLDAKAVHLRADRLPYAAARCPLWPPTSLLSTSTPHASLHYK
jgi:hypothetical protein